MFEITSILSSEATRKVKVIDYHGYNLIVPEYVNYIAIDKNGTMVVYKNKPYIEDDEDFWTIDDNEYEVLEMIAHYKGNWKDSLFEVE